MGRDYFRIDEMVVGGGSLGEDNLGSQICVSVW